MRVMRIPNVHGLIKRRLLVNFRANPQVVQKLLPAPFKPKFQAGYAIIGICLIRLENIRMIGVPSLLGISSENAAHRVAVEWTNEKGEPCEGVFIPRRDTSSWFNRMVGGRIFPGEHQGADFEITDKEGKIDFQMRSHDKTADIFVKGSESAAFPASSCFPSLAASSEFFKRGCLGYSVTSNPKKLDGLELCTTAWNVGALEVQEVRSSYFENRAIFPAGSVEFDHALIMRDLEHEWHQAEDMVVQPEPAAVR